MGDNNEEVKNKRSKEEYIGKAQKLYSLWNEHSGALSKVTSLSPSRLRKLKVRINENPDLDYWQGLIKKMAASDFCCQGNWATFDWLISNDTNHIKVSEGKYDNRKEIDNTPQPVERNDL